MGNYIYIIILYYIILYYIILYYIIYCNIFFLPVRLPSEIQKLPPDLPMRGFPGVWKLPLLRLPSRDRSPSLDLLSLFLSFIFCPTPFKTMGCFSGRLMSSASGQKLFCEVCSEFKCSFDEFVGEKVVSPSYSSAILASPLYIVIYIVLYCHNIYEQLPIYRYIHAHTHTHMYVCILAFPPKCFF